MEKKLSIFDQRELTGVEQRLDFILFYAEIASKRQRAIFRRAIDSADNDRYLEMRNL